MKRKNLVKRLISAAVALTLLTGFQSDLTAIYSSGKMDCVKAATQLKGSGTENEPYLISSADDFITMINGLPTEETKNVTPCYYRQTQDISISGYSGVGADKMFYGTYDGQGYSIYTEVSVKDSSSGVSIFPYVFGTIYNLGIKGSIRITEKKDVSVGGICRSVRDGGKIINCWCSSRLKSEGGEVGAISASAEANATIQNCYYKGKITASDNYAITRAKNGAKIVDCYYMLDTGSSDVSDNQGTSNSYKASGEKTEKFELTKLNNAVATAQKTYTKYTLCKYQKCDNGDFAFEKIKAAATATPTQKPTASPTAKASATPTIKVTATPTAKASATPTIKVTATPTAKASATPTPKVTVTPTAKASATPTPKVSLQPTISPGVAVSLAPTVTTSPDAKSTANASPSPGGTNSAQTATSAAVVPDVIIDGEEMPNGNVFVANDIGNAKVTMEQKYIYTGYSVGAEYSVEMNGKKLEEGQDYIVSYENNIEVGIANLVITGIGIYTGTKKVAFFIVKSISMLQLSTINSVTYSGKEIVPNVVIVDGKYVLKQNADYKLTVTNNINPGKAKVKITGIGKYTGTITKTFTIKKINIKNVKISITKAIITKQKTRITFKVKNGKVTLKNKVDYTLTYKLNKKKNKVTVVIKAKNNYTGTKKITLKI
ncbi:MAG: hypothetical protein II838_04120 [Lachnospiraceae bacterium]|nr:hypothetical protein [Lachnospiraceae bacterium]